MQEFQNEIQYAYLQLLEGTPLLDAESLTFGFVYVRRRTDGDVDHAVEEGEVERCRDTLKVVNRHVQSN